MAKNSMHHCWDEPGIGRMFRAAVSLHSHTSESVESLSFLPLLAHSIPGVSALVRRQEKRYEKKEGRHLDYSRAYWTPPLSAYHVYGSERQQIESMLGGSAFVSVTDHDSISACSMLQLIHRNDDIPCSLEWTVPFNDTVFHVGVHNLPADQAPSIVAELTKFSRGISDTSLEDLLSQLDSLRQVLLVLNHPTCNQSPIGDEDHLKHLRDFARLCGSWIHAIELNGLHPWADNQLARELADSLSLPVVSGGDRHGREPNANLNLTNARSFSEFVQEIRNDRVSTIAFMPHYREPMVIRVLESIRHALQEYPQYPGRQKWTDRIYYRNDEGQSQSLSALWVGGSPRLVRAFLRLSSLLASPSLQPALRFAFALRNGVFQWKMSQEWLS